MKIRLKVKITKRGIIIAGNLLAAGFFAWAVLFAKTELDYLRILVWGAGIGWFTSVLDRIIKDPPENG